MTFTFTQNDYPKWIQAAEPTEPNVGCLIRYTSYPCGVSFMGKAYIQNKKKAFVLVLYWVIPPKLKVSRYLIGNSYEIELHDEKCSMQVVMDYCIRSLFRNRNESPITQPMSYL